MNIFFFAIIINIVFAYPHYSQYNSNTTKFIDIYTQNYNISITGNHLIYKLDNIYNIQNNELMHEKNQNINNTYKNRIYASVTNDTTPFFVNGLLSSPFSLTFKKIFINTLYYCGILCILRGFFDLFFNDD